MVPQGQEPRPPLVARQEVVEERLLLPPREPPHRQPNKKVLYFIYQKHIFTNHSEARLWRDARAMGCLHPFFRTEWVEKRN